MRKELPIIKITTKSTYLMGEISFEYRVYKYSRVRNTYNLINSFFKEQSAIQLKLDLIKGVI